jgi:hypothetical protein
MKIAARVVWGRKDEKKPPGLLAVSRVFGVLRVLSTLSIRQRSEIPKEVKVKLRGGHGEKLAGT